MPGLLSVAVMLLSPAHPAAQAPTCSVDSIQPSERARMLERYRAIKQTRGAAAADGWIRQEGLALYRRMAAEGRCSPSKLDEDRNAEAATSSREAAAPLLNRHGQPCRRIELENQNVPNIGGSMGWALVQVCKD